MSTNLFDRMRLSLMAQRRNLQDWLAKTPAPRIKLRLGPEGENSIEEHLKVLDTAIVRANDQTLGLCEVCHDYVEPTRLEVDYTACVCIEHMTGDQKTRLEEELELSKKVQKALLPQEIPSIPGLTISAYSQPAQIVGGDYFDFFQFKDGQFGFALGDVMGKGMPASLLMANLQASLRILVRENVNPDLVMDRLNRLFIHNVRLTKFVTLFLGHYDASQRVLTFTNAGHNPPLWLRNGAEGGSVSLLHPNGAAVGLVEESQFRSETIHLQSGDALVFYTDGITETRNPNDEEFGEGRLIELVQSHRNRSSAELVRTIRESAKSFAGKSEASDDTTIMAITVG